MLRVIWLNLLAKANNNKLLRAQTGHFQQSSSAYTALGPTCHQFSLKRHTALTKQNLCHTVSDSVGAEAVDLSSTLVFCLFPQTERIVRYLITRIL